MENCVAPGLDAFDVLLEVVLSLVFSQSNFCLDGLTPEITAKLSEIPGTTQTESTSVGLFVRKRSKILLSLVGSWTVWVRQLSSRVETKSWYVSGWEQLGSTSGGIIHLDWTSWLESCLVHWQKHMCLLPAIKNPIKQLTDCALIRVDWIWHLSEVSHC